HTIAAGQAFMGSWTDERIADYAADGLEEFTAHTVTTLVGLRQRVGEVRRTGVAWTVGEFSEEITGVAAPVCDADGEVVASVTVYGPGFRFPGGADTCEIERLVAETAERVGALLVD
ncbi:MAG: IclR family transcriptional regulator C-terminal domain-containing protein, partial [Acidimicrobiales bacterium]